MKKNTNNYLKLLQNKLARMLSALTSGGEWANINYAFSQSYYQGITILRVADLTTNGQAMYGNFYGLIALYRSNAPSSCPILPGQ